MDRNDNFVIFKTIDKANIVIVEQPAVYLERYPASNKLKAGQVKRKRQIQYVDYLDTIFVDEQKLKDDNPKINHIYLSRKGSIKVSKDDVTLIKFLRLHPDNVANGGKQFREFNLDKENQLEIESWEKLNKAESHIISGENENLVRSMAVWFLGNSYLHQDISKLKKTLILKLRNDVTFVDDVNAFVEDKNNEEKLAVTIALKEEIIIVVGGRSIAWAENTSEIIFLGSQSQDVVREYAIWVKTSEDGRAHLKMLLSKIEEKKK